MANSDMCLEAARKVFPNNEDSRVAYMLGFNDGFDKTKEQLEVDIVSAAKVFLEALSKTPYNNKPITDAQIIVKQLLLFLETPSKYNPDAIVEQSEVDIEEEAQDEYYKYAHYESGSISGEGYHLEAQGHYECYLTRNEFKDIARHFYELGLNTRKK